MQCDSETACGSVGGFFFSPAPWSESCRCRKASAAERGRGLHFHHFVVVAVVVVTLDSYQQLPKFPASVMKDNYDKLHSSCMTVVIDTEFRPLFYGIVQPEALLSFRPSSLSNPPPPPPNPRWAFAVGFFTENNNIPVLSGRPGPS